jgi:hypothetical protein
VGIEGIATASSGNGVYGSSTNGIAIYGASGTGMAVFGATGASAAGTAAVKGVNTSTSGGVGVIESTTTARSGHRPSSRRGEHLLHLDELAGDPDDPGLPEGVLADTLSSNRAERMARQRQSPVLPRYRV